MSHRFRTNFTSISQRFHFAFTSLSQRFHVDFTMITQRFHNSFTTMSHQFRHDFKTLSQRSHISRPRSNPLVNSVIMQTQPRPYHEVTLSLSLLSLDSHHLSWIYPLIMTQLRDSGTGRDQAVLVFAVRSDRVQRFIRPINAVITHH